MTVADAAELLAYWVECPPPHELLSITARGMVWKPLEVDAARSKAFSKSVTRSGSLETTRSSISLFSASREEMQQFSAATGIPVMKRGG